MKTETQLARTEMELHAVEAARSMLRFLGYGPPTSFRPHGDTWKSHCDAFGSHLDDELSRGEFWLNNPDYKFG